MCLAQAPALFFETENVRELRRNQEVPCGLCRRPGQAWWPGDGPHVSARLLQSLSTWGWLQSMWLSRGRASLALTSLSSPPLTCPSWRGSPLPVLIDA